jgi:hypothetical protein
MARSACRFRPDRSDLLTHEPPRHDRTRPGHPRLHGAAVPKTWMAGSSPAMTGEVSEDVGAIDGLARATPPVRRAIANSREGPIADFRWWHLSRPGTPRGFDRSGR